MQTKKKPGSTDWTDLDDAPHLTTAMLNDAEVFVGDTFVRRGAGRSSSGSTKEQVSVRLDRDVLDELRKAGPGWQSQVNTLLRAGLALDRPETVTDLGTSMKQASK